MSTAPHTSETPALDLRDVFKIYREGASETVALRGLDLRVERGEIVALMGRSGAGKSTLLNLIGGMDIPSAGRVLVGGQDMGRLDEAARRAAPPYDRLRVPGQQSAAVPDGP